MNLREPLASTHHANLDWAEHEKAIDKIAASGRCDEIGVLLWKTKYMYESWAYKKLRTLLLKLHGEKFRFENPIIIEKVVDQVIHEFLSDKCKTCNGAKELIVGDRRVVCETCLGHGLRKYKDEDRARSMKIALGKVKHSGVQRQFRFLVNELGTRDAVVNTELIRQLEK